MLGNAPKISKNNRWKHFSWAVARRGISVLLAAFMFASPSSAQDSEVDTQKIFEQITAHFNSVQTMTGSFIQIDPRGNQVEGKFYIERPGKMRFDYEESYPLRILADGKAVFINNKKLKNWKVYPLRSTPVNLLLGKKIKLNSDSVKNIREEAGLTVVTLGDKTVFGKQLIRLMFDTQSFELRQWNTIDEQGGETQVLVFDVRDGVTFAKGVFRVPYDEVHNR